jgi:hypothetical protein
MDKSIWCKLIEVKGGDLPPQISREKRINILTDFIASPTTTYSIFTIYLCSWQQLRKTCRAV